MEGYEVPPPDLGMGGEGGSAELQAGRRGGGLERWMSACWLWRAPIIMGAHPHNNGCAPSS